MATVGRLVSCAVVSMAALAPAAEPDPPPESPRIESVVPLPRQPHEDDPAVIWYDDFDGPPRRYTEGRNAPTDESALGGSGKSLPMIYEKGRRGTGNRKVFFGDSPTGRVVRRGERFTDVYWRIYVKHQPGWTGGSPAKMSRATSIVSGRWNQAMIAHVWGGGGLKLTLDPAGGVRGGRVVTRRYNDFARLRWLGNKPPADFPIHARRESGWWVCVEARARLNTPGKADGLNQLWIDARLGCQRKKLNWVGTYTARGINAVFLEAYWNKGSPVTQTRWFDNFVISARPIGPVVCPPNPVLIKTPFRGSGERGPWQVELAADPEGRTVVWRSGPVTAAGRVRVDAETGRFVATRAGKARLAGGATYWARVREKPADGTYGRWSRWHQGFAVVGESTKEP